MTVWTDNADRFAHRDRGEHADQVLDAACRDAIGVLRIGIEYDDPHARSEARRILAKAELSAGRVLGGAR